MTCTLCHTEVARWIRDDDQLLCDDRHDEDDSQLDVNPPRGHSPEPSTNPKTVPVSPVSILTEDWFAGYLSDEDTAVPDGEDETLEAYREAVDIARQYDEEISPTDDLAIVLQAQAEAARDDLQWLSRDEDDATILHRYDRPEDDLEVLDLIAENSLQTWNVEILLAFRRAQLHRVARAYFGTADYLEREIVLKWEQTNGRWIPAEKMPVGGWIASLVQGQTSREGDERGGNRLAGYYSALQTLRYKLVRRNPKTPFGPTSRVLASDEVRRVVSNAVAASRPAQSAATWSCRTTPGGLASGLARLFLYSFRSLKEHGSRSSENQKGREDEMLTPVGPIWTRLNMLDCEIRTLDQQIADAEASLSRHGWPEIATELPFLEKRAELEAQYEDVSLDASELRAGTA